MIFQRVHEAFAEFRGGAVRPPSKYAPAVCPHDKTKTAETKIAKNRDNPS